MSAPTTERLRELAAAADTAVTRATTKNRTRSVHIDLTVAQLRVRELLAALTDTGDGGAPGTPEGGTP